MFRNMLSAQYQYVTLSEINVSEQQEITGEVDLYEQLHVLPPVISAEIRSVQLLDVSTGALRTDDVVNPQKKKKNRTMHECDVCHKLFPFACLLRNHYGVHLEEKPHRCSMCGSGFTRMEHLQRHMRRHTGQNLHKCDFCEATFVIAEHAQRHRRIHTGEKPFKCDVCGKRFSEQGNWKTHLRTHTNERPFKCETCGREFKQKGHLKDHATVHSGERSYRCMICDKAFAHSSAMLAHMRAHGDCVKLRGCPECGKKFRQEVYLRKHMRRHAEDKEMKYTCFECDRPFAHSENLRRHMKIHSVVRPFTCEICQRRFTHAQNLRRHALTHDGERRFECKICGKRFVHAQSAARHSRLHEGEPGADGLVSGAEKLAPVPGDNSSVVQRLRMGRRSSNVKVELSDASAGREFKDFQEAGLTYEEVGCVEAPLACELECGSVDDDEAEDEEEEYGDESLDEELDNDERREELEDTDLMKSIQLLTGDEDQCELSNLRTVCVNNELLSFPSDGFETSDTTLTLGVDGSCEVLDQVETVSETDGCGTDTFIL